MANLNDLSLNAETIDDVDVETVPTFAGSNPVPQPGLYKFRLPTPQVIFNCFEKEQTSDQGERIRAIFAGEASLKNETLNQFYDARISNRTRAITLKSGEVVKVSDMAQLLRVLESIPDTTSNVGYGNALVRCGTKAFIAEHTITANCSKTRDIYKAGAVVPGKKGCGAKYAQDAYVPKNGPAVQAIPKDGEKFQLRFACKCGAELRCWGQLRGFRKATD